MTRYELVIVLGAELVALGLMLISPALAFIFAGIGLAVLGVLGRP